MDIEKFTVIYGEWFQIGSHHNSITKYTYITCKEEDIFNELEKLEIVFTQVWYIFKGHCESV